MWATEKAVVFPVMRFCVVCSPAPPGSTRAAPTAAPSVFTFQRPTARRAVPDGELPPFLISTVNVQFPAATCTEPDGSTSQPLPVGAVGAVTEGVQLLATFAGTPGANSTQPHVVAVQAADPAV